MSTAISAFAPDGRRNAALLRAACMLAALAIGACASPRAPLPSPGDCVTLRLWSNGYHTNIALPAALLEADHPIRELFPDAEHFLIGWGERDYYMEPDPGAWDALVAAAWPTSSAVQLIAGDRPVEESVWRAREVVEFSVSEAGVDRLIDGVTETLAVDARGGPIVIGEGRVAGASVFLAARPAFHLFFMCNHWTAARLRDAGVPVHAWPSFTAPGLMDAVREKAPPCRD